MEFIKIILTSVGSIIALFFSTKIIGNKQMSELSMFDYINGITIGSIAAEMATSLDGKFYYPLTAIVIYTVIMWFISYLTEKNIKLRRFFTGRSIVLMQSGKIYQKNFKISKIDINDFLVQCRINGFFMEENLKLSGNNKKWLENELQKQKIGNVKDVFIALCDGNNTLSVYKKTDDSPKNDPFQ